MYLQQTNQPLKQFLIFFPKRIFEWSLVSYSDALFSKRIGQALDNSLQYDIIYLDLSKASETVSHSLHLQNLTAAGINGSLF